MHSKEEIVKEEKKKTYYKTTVFENVRDRREGRRHVLPCGTTPGGQVLPYIWGTSQKEMVMSKIQERG